MKEVAVLLHNVRSAHNVGSIFRTCDAAGVRRVYLSGYTPAPVDRFGRPQKDIAKTALGAQGVLQWKHAKNPNVFLSTLRREGWTIVGVEQDASARDYRSYNVPTNVLYVFGNEVRGLSTQLKRSCDALVEIPMHGKKESLNVSVAAGIILFSAIN